MPLGDFVFSFFLHLVGSKAWPNKKKRRVVEQYDDEFGLIRWDWRRQCWEASVRLADPDVDAVVRMDGSRGGPFMDSRQRAYELVGSWPRRSAGPLARAIDRRERHGDGFGPYRTGDEGDTTYERHDLERVWLDARDEIVEVKAKLRGHRRMVELRLHEWSGGDERLG